MKRIFVFVMLVLLSAGCSSSSKRSNPQPATTTVAPRAPSDAVAIPKVTGPVTGGTPDLPVNAMLVAYKTRYGYSENEYFIEGTATAYRPRGALGVDGKWSVTKGSTAPYKTRIIVRTPNDPARFNGTVVVEWLNVTAGRDSDPDFGFAGPELLREGFAYVGVTTQKVGVGGGPGLTLPIPGYHPKPLIDQNPARYRGLHHPGDDYAYDIFSQAAQALLAPNGPRPLGALQPRHLIATGESQSAFEMVTYANAIEPLTHIFDGFLIHSRGSGGGTLDASAAKPTAIEKGAHIRGDLDVPVLTLITETDLFGLGFYPARQPDTDLLRTWEMAGTAHADQSTLDYGIASGRQWDTTSKVPDFTGMCGSINDGPQLYIERAAFAALGKWVADGIAPPHAPPITVRDGKIGRDARGNALGGIRTPAVDVPTEALSGEWDSSKSVICSLFGVATPFDDATLKSLYPTHDDYVAKVNASAASAVKAGFLLRPDADEIVQRAESARIP